MLRCVLLAILLGSCGCTGELSPGQAKSKIVFQLSALDGTNLDSEVLKKVQAIAEKRLRNVSEMPRFRLKVSQSNHLEVFTPKLTDEQVKRIRSLLTRPGKLEFALLANRRDHATLIDQVLADGPLELERLFAEWHPCRHLANGTQTTIDGSGDVVSREVEVAGGQQLEYLVVRPAEQFRLSGEIVKSTHLFTSDQGLDSLGFELTERAGDLMTVLTTNSQPDPDGFKRRLAILLDGEINSAPTINAVIGDKGVIDGEFTREELELLNSALNSGQLPCRVEFIEQIDIAQGDF